MTFSTVAVVSYRLGGIDGVSVEAAKWVAALRRLGLTVRTVAGEGPPSDAGGPDVTVPGLGAWEAAGPDPGDLEEALAGADVVVAENICSLPLNPAATRAVAAALAGRPAVLHHHDLPWQRPDLGDTVPHDPAWVHVAINELSRRQLAERGVEAVTVYNAFDPDPPPGDRGGARSTLGVAERELLVLQPTRAIARKNVAGGLALARELGATFWLTGPTEEGYGPELDALLKGAGIRVIRRAAFAVDGPGPPSRELAEREMADAYAAADLVVLPSLWEGFGNPAVEAGLHGRPVVVGPYPVADELRPLGFRWFGLEEVPEVRRLLASADRGVVDINREVARRELSTRDLPARLAGVLDRLSSRL